MHGVTRPSKRWPLNSTADSDAVVALVNPDIEKTAKKLEKKKFEPDPITGLTFSKITSVCSSIYKRHGTIIERAILQSLKQCDRFEVWAEKKFWVPDTVDHIVTSAAPLALIGASYPYRDSGHRKLQVDVLVYNKSSRILRSYEVKRGAGTHDSGKTRSMLRDMVCTQVLLKSYGEQRGLLIDMVSSHIIFYYGYCGRVPEPFSISGGELDEHFDWPVIDAVACVNVVFKARVLSVLDDLGYVVETEEVAE